MAARPSLARSPRPSKRSSTPEAQVPSTFVSQLACDLACARDRPGAARLAERPSRLAFVRSRAAIRRCAPRLRGGSSCPSSRRGTIFRQLTLVGGRSTSLPISTQSDGRGTSAADGALGRWFAGAFDRRLQALARTRAPSDEHGPRPARSPGDARSPPPPQLLARHRAAQIRAGPPRLQQAQRAAGPVTSSARVARTPLVDAAEREKRGTLPDESAHGASGAGHGASLVSSRARALDVSSPLEQHLDRDAREDDTEEGEHGRREPAVEGGGLQPVLERARVVEEVEALTALEVVLAR